MSESSGAPARRVGSRSREESLVVWNALLSYVSQLVAGVVGILLVPYLLVRLGKDAYGVIGIASSFLGLVTLIEAGVGPGVVRQFTRFLQEGDFRRANETASTAAAAYATVTLLLLPTALLAGGPLLEVMQVPAPLRTEGAIVLGSMVLALGATMLSAPYGAALFAELRYDVRHWARIASTLARAGIVVGLFALWQPSLLVWGAATLSGTVVSLLMHVAAARRACPHLEIRGSHVSWRGVRDTSAFGLQTSTIHLSQWARLQSGTFVISFFLGTAAVAHYTPALLIVASLLPLSRGFLSQLAPVVTKAHVAGDRDKIGRVLIRSTRYSLILAGGAFVGVGSLASLLIPLWLGPGFEDTALVLSVACAISVLDALTGGSFAVLLGTDRLRAITLFEVLLTLLGVALAIHFVGFTPLGIVGAELGSLVAQVVRTGAWTRAATRACGTSPGRYLRESALGPLVALAGLGVTSAAVQATLQVRPWIELLLAGGASLLVFSGLAWGLGLDREDRRKALDYAARGLSRARNAFGHGRRGHR